MLKKLKSEVCPRIGDVGLAPLTIAFKMSMVRMELVSCSNASELFSCGGASDVFSCEGASEVPSEPVQG